MALAVATSSLPMSAGSVSPRLERTSATVAPAYPAAIAVPSIWINPDPRWRVGTPTPGAITSTYGPRCESDQAWPSGVAAPTPITPS